MSQTVWIVDDDSSVRWVLGKALRNANITCKSFDDPYEALACIENGESPNTIISDMHMPNMNGVELLEQTHSYLPNLPFIIMTAQSDLDSAVTAFQGGAFEYLPKPFAVEEALGIVNRALEHVAKETPQAEVLSKAQNKEIIGSAPAMQEVFRAIGRLSRSSISVLIQGESGTGKELVAKALHKHSPRSKQNFVALNMAAIPKDLVESELFGHEKGAFTGAQAKRIGRFEQADGGTLFLDEIGDMPIDIQTRLLRVLADGQFYRVGGHNPVVVNVRIIAATHQNLQQRVSEGKFRADLYHRLNVIKINMPKLDERKQDIPLLAQHFLVKASQELQVEAKTLSKAASDRLMLANWPGNVRQLENTCRWLTVMASGQEISVNDLPQEHLESSDDKHGESHLTQQQHWTAAFATWVTEQLNEGKDNIANESLEDFEKILIDCALTHTKGRKQLAAKRLGWGRNTLTRKLSN